MGRYRERDQQSVGGIRHQRSLGQSTVEFAVVFFGFLSMVAALGVLWRVASDGLLVAHALQSASHHLETVVPGVVADVFLY